MIALSADPPSWLDWSSGLLTDEGFYTLDARHEALFGHSAPGDFHDRLLSPLLSLLQQGVFEVWGAGLIQARMVSVVFGLLTIVVFWQSLRLAYDERTALIGALLLGLAPPFTFFNRLGLQETPTVFWLVLAFALWSAWRGHRSRSREWSLAAGGALAVALVFKMTALLALPAFAAAAAYAERLCAGDAQTPHGYKKQSVALLLGFGAGLLLYGVLWYAPHHAALTRMTAYYRERQVMPHAWHSVLLNIRRGFADPARGVLPYLLKTMPVLSLLALLSLRRRRWGAADILLVVWLLGGLAFCLLSSYAPDRYDVLFLPPLAGLAARGLAGLRRSWAIAAAVLFVVTSGYWYARAWETRTYAERDASRALGALLPHGAVVIGEMAPALCLGTPYAAAPVQPGLSNDDHPVERLHATTVVVTRAPVWMDWWHTHYPSIAHPSHQIATLRLSGPRQTIVDVYSVTKRRLER
jgi:4-amino-4-deoxy-L-arabinose transferase-like glycosyltransferase